MYPADYVNQISFFNMSMRASPGRTYKFYTGTPVYEFGTGLSYTQFTCKWSQDDFGEDPLRMSLEKVGNVSYQVEVTNTGKMGGAISVLAYITSDVKDAPMKQLFSFQKVYLAPGEKKDLFFSATPETFKFVNERVSK